MSDTNLVTIAEDVITPTKRKGRPKGSKNKPKITHQLSGSGLKVDDLIGVDPFDEGEVEKDHPEINPSWIQVVLKSEMVEDGLPMIVHAFGVKGVSKLPDGGASIILNVGTNQPMILTTLTPYEKVIDQVLDTPEW